MFRKTKTESDSNSTQQVHTSFRLTPSLSVDDESDSRETFRSAVVFSLAIQAALLVFSSLILDGGRIFNHVAIASIGYLVSVVLMKLRRNNDKLYSDLVVVKWLYLPLLLVTLILSALRSLVWSWTGLS